MLAAAAFVAPASVPAAWADGLMLIQAGAFWMGSDTDGENERPQHRVFVRDTSEDPGGR